MKHIIDINLEIFIINRIPNGKIVFATPSSGIGEYSLIGKVIGSEKKHFLWWEWYAPKVELICEIINNNVIRYINQDHLSLLIGILSEFESKSGREIKLIKRKFWQQFS